MLQPQAVANAKTSLTLADKTVAPTLELEPDVNQDLKSFLWQWLRVALMTLAPVVFVAFASMPYALGGHPGEHTLATVHSDGHMT